MLNRHFTAFAIAGLAASVVAGATARQVPTAPPPIAFVGVSVVPMDTDRLLDRHTVVVSGGRITAIGPESEVSVPAKARTIDGRGKYLMPGLAEMHAHLPPFPGDSGDPADIHMRLYLANGVTTVRGMMGHPAHLVLRDRVARGQLTGPTLVVASPPVHGKNAPDAAAAEQVVTDLKRQEFDLIKVWEGLSPASYDAIASASKRLGIPIAGHVTATVGLDRALAARQSSIEHLDGYLQALVPREAAVQPPPSQLLLGPVQKHVNDSRMKPLAEATRVAGVYNTPTLTLFRILMSEGRVEEFLKWPELRYVSSAMRNQFAAQKEGTYAIPATAGERQRFVELRDRMTKALAEAGAPLLAGSDSPQMFLVPGFGLHREIRSLRDAGVSTFATLAAATRHPAAYLGKESDFGTIAVGRRADFLLLDANPLQDVSAIERRAGVMVRGTWLTAEALQKMLDEIAASHASAAR